MANTEPLPADLTTEVTSEAQALRTRGERFASVLVEGAELTDALREVADWLERTWSRHLDMPVPMWSAYYRADVRDWRPRLGFYAHDRASFEATVRALADGAPKVGPVRKDVDTYDDDYLEATRQLGSVLVRVWTARENICVRRVVGTETVEVPDPNAAMVEVERDVVEWDCSPVLTGVDVEDLADEGD